MINIIRADLNNKEHQKAICELLNIYIADKMGGSGEPLSNEKQKALIEGLSDNPNSIILLAISEEKFIGMSVCFVNFSTFMVKKMLNIHDIIVHPNERNKGIGRMLLTVVEHEARELDCGKITLEVRNDNINAKHLYNSMDFKECNPPMHFLVKSL